MERIRNKTKSNPIIGILCEGESEKQYFTMLKQKYRLANIKVKIVAADLSGKSLVEKAVKFGKYNHLDKTYVVFDRDEHSKDELRKCAKLARKNDITIMFSSIDFEIWILMHFESVTRSYTRKELVQKLSRSAYFNQDYSRFKGNSYREYIFDKVQDAVDHANKLYRKKSDWINDDPFTNIQIENMSLLKYRFNQSDVLRPNTINYHVLIDSNGTIFETVKSFV